MDLTVKRSGISCCERIFEYDMPVEEAVETVVPDTMPDVERILCAEGVVIIRSKEVSDGRAAVSAGVSATVLYVPDGDGGICTLGTTVPVSVDVEAPGVTENSLAVAVLTLTNIEARMLNPRKLLVRAVVNVRLECYNCTELEVTTGLEGEGAVAVETLCEPSTISPVVYVREKTFVVSDEYRLQPGLLPIGRLLWHSAEIIPGGVRSVGSKLIFNGTVRLSVLYEAEASSELCSARFETEFSQMLDTESELGSPDCSVWTLLTAEYIEAVTLAGGERGISAEYHLVSQCVCTDSLRVSSMTDCYSNESKLSIGRTQTELPCVRRRATLRASASETLSASPPPVSIAATICRPGVAVCENGALKCPVSVLVIYTAGDGGTYFALRRVTCETSAELSEGEYAACVRAYCVESSAAIAQGGIDVRLTVEFELVSAKKTVLTQIDSVEPVESTEAAESPSITVIRASEGDTLWTLGKRYHSTGALISEQNGLAEGDRLAGRVLLIPRAHV